MSFIEALLLGIVQGLTEFLPVSSSGHLEIAKAIIGSELTPSTSLMFTIVVHLATAFATIVIFRKDIKSIFLNIFKGDKADRKFSFAILVSLFPAAIIGIFFNDFIEVLFSGNILLVGFMLIVTGILLILTDQAKDRNIELNYFTALIIGLSQAIAILPGISRSGATISTSVLLGMDREKAARFSFLMVIPLILGKVIIDLKDISSFTDSNQIYILATGFISAFFTGLWACKLMIRLVKRARLKGFAIYCGSIGILVLIWTQIF
jgi:undecaprenyl-diphosphatase